MKTRSIYLLLLTFYCHLIQFCTGAETRVFQGCTLVNTKIFCYGGYHADPNDTSKSVALTTHLMMNMALIDFNYLNRTTHPWANVSTLQQSDYVLETRSSFEMTTVNDTSYLIHGGCLDPGCRSMLNNATIQYDTLSNTWKTLGSPPYTIIHSGMVYSDNTAYMWGGNLANDTNGYAPNVLFTLKMNTTLPSWVLTPLGVGPNIPNITRTGHSTTLLDDGRIFYLGGALGTRMPTKSDKYAVMDHATIFDTTSNKWDVLEIHGITIAPRKFHTATAVKGSSLVAIYGGIKSDDALETSHNFIKETCVLLDTQTMNYSSLQFDKGGDFPGRYGHSAILYNSYLLLLFGINGNNGQHNYADDIAVLDFTDINNPFWLGNISDTVRQPTKTNNGSTTDLPTPPSSGSTKGLSPGGIAGVSVGCAIAGVGLATWLLLLRQRRQKRRSDFQLQESDPRFSYDQSAAAMSKVYETGGTTTTDTTSERDMNGRSAGRMSPLYQQPSPQLRAIRFSSDDYYQQQQQRHSSPIYSLDPITSKPDILVQQHATVDDGDGDGDGTPPPPPRTRYKPDEGPSRSSGGSRFKPDGQDD